MLRCTFSLTILLGVTAVATGAVSSDERLPQLLPCLGVEGHEPPPSNDTSCINCLWNNCVWNIDQSLCLRNCASSSDENCYFPDGDEWYCRRRPNGEKLEGKQPPAAVMDTDDTVLHLLEPCDSDYYDNELDTDCRGCVDTGECVWIPEYELCLNACPDDADDEDLNLNFTCYGPYPTQHNRTRTRTRDLSESRFYPPDCHGRFGINTCDGSLINCPDCLLAGCIWDKHRQHCVRDCEHDTENVCTSPLEDTKMIRYYYRRIVPQQLHSHVPSSRQECMT